MESIVAIVAIVSIVAMTSMFTYNCICVYLREKGKFKHDAEINSDKLSIKSGTEIDIDKHESMDIKNK